MKKILLFLLFSQFFFSQQWSISFAERNALISIYNSTSGDQWSQKWDMQKDPKYWYGIKIKNGSVTEINLRGNALKGNFPQQVSLFNNLQKLDLSSNQLTGDIPQSLGASTGLVRLDISNNRFTGDPTAALLPLTNLTELSIGNNNFAIGDIETFLQNFPKIETLDLAHIGLTAVPQNLSQIPKLTALNLSNNSLSQNFGNLSALISLQELDLSGNGLTKIPSEIAPLTRLTSLNVGNNLFTTNFAGPLASLLNLQWLSFQGNQISDFPAELSQLTKLIHLNFADNKISSGFQQLRILKDLEQIFLDKNLITTFPETLLQLRNLQMLSLTNNQISGEIPDNIPALTFLDNNRFTKQQIKNFILKEKQLADFTYSPQRYDDPLTIAVNPGAPANLQQSLSGPEFQFTWFKNLDQKTNVTSENYYLNSTREEDFTQYTCEVYYFEQLPKELMEVAFYREPITLNKELATAEVNRELVVYPNPATDFINIKSMKIDIEKVFIHDLSGKMVYSGNERRISVSHLPSSTYVISIKTSDGVKSFKFIKY